jgi:hypothetical protein
MSLRFRLFLLVLLIGWAAALVGSYSRALADWEQPLRLGSSMLLVLLAWGTRLEYRSARLHGLAGGVAVGMTLGCLGDFVMGEVLTWMPSPILSGMILFGLGHLAYQVGCELAWRRLAKVRPRRWWLAVLAWQVVNWLAWGWIVYPAVRHHELVWPALAYGALLAGTAGVMSGLMFEARIFAPMAVGAALFLFSDLMIAVRLFQSQSWPEPLIWATYGPGQMLIVAGTALAVAHAERNARPEA